MSDRGDQAEARQFRQQYDDLCDAQADAQDRVWHAMQEVADYSRDRITLVASAVMKLGLDEAGAEQLFGEYGAGCYRKIVGH